ncbi:hypothetical protein Zmor_028481 [Zophobas morio]|uniref:Uncharacterized protein n=1 Tax=Zophobas morio TaxID=2755281 RepID=A0AA38HSS5_9CUCU|nr:hypothetical protein Zmor_028481 [Zophobas morio]
MTEKTPPNPSIVIYPEWNDTDTILFYFFWGYILTQLGTGQLSEYCEPKWFLVGIMAIGSLFHKILR